MFKGSFFFIFALVFLATCSSSVLAGPEAETNAWEDLDLPPMIGRWYMDLFYFDDALYFFTNDYPHMAKKTIVPNWKAKKKPTLLRWKGKSWESLPLPDVFAQGSKLLVFRNRLHLLCDGVYRMEGGKWSQVGGPPPVGAMALQDSYVTEGGIYLSYNYRDHLRVTRFRDGEWADLGVSVVKNSGCGSSIMVHKGRCYVIAHWPNGTQEVYLYGGGSWKKIKTLFEGKGPRDDSRRGRFITHSNLLEGSDGVFALFDPPGSGPKLLRLLGPRAGELSSSLGGSQQGPFHGVIHQGNPTYTVFTHYHGAEERKRKYRYSLSMFSLTDDGWRSVPGSFIPGLRAPWSSTKGRNSAIVSHGGWLYLARLEKWPKADSFNIPKVYRLRVGD